MPDQVLSPGASVPAEVFTRHGLAATGFWGSLALPPPPGLVRPAPDRLREALAELGGLYLAFARFLLWRADLLSSEYLASLRLIAAPPSRFTRDQFAARLTADYGPDVAAPLIHGLDDHPVWSTLSRTAYRTWQRGRRIVIETANPIPSDADLKAFTEGIKALGHTDLARATAPAIIAQFAEWLTQSASLKQERTYLEVLALHRAETLVDYPALIEELTTDNLLAWPWIDAEPASRLVRNGSSAVVTKIAAAVLEQYCSLAILDAELDLDQMALQRDGRVVMWRVNRAMAVPPPQVNIGMKYIAAALLGESTAMVQTLVPMSTGTPSQEKEKTLLDLLSGVEPELKVHLWFPRAAAVFESNWMALAKLVPARPLFLDCLHRNLVAVGYWNAAAVAAGGPMTDAVADAHSAVVASVLRTQVGNLMNPRSATEWGVGAGLVAFGVMREANRFAEEVRDNNLTMSVEVTETGASSKPANNSARLAVLIGVLLVVLLVSLRWGADSTGPLLTLTRITAIASALGLFWLVAKLS